MQSVQGVEGWKNNLIKKVLIKMYIHYCYKLLDKKMFSREKTFVTQDLNIFAEIKFRECYQIKYFVVPNFREIAKKREIAKLCFVKVSYVKVVEKSSGEKPLSLGNSSDASQDEISQIT